MNRYRVETKVKRKIKLIRTASHRTKMIWAGWLAIVIYAALVYLKGVGKWP